jgi:hypothetical protein
MREGQLTLKRAPADPKRLYQNSRAGSTEATIVPRRNPSDTAMWCRVIAYGAVFIPFLLALTLAHMQPELDNQELPDWKPMLALAEVMREKGELANASDLFSRAGRLAGWKEDWAGLLAAACGMKKLHGDTGPHSVTHALVLRAAVAAETRQSRSGLAAAAQALAALGENKAAARLSSLVHQNRATEASALSGSLSPNCWSS